MEWISIFPPEKNIEILSVNFHQKNQNYLQIQEQYLLQSFNNQAKEFVLHGFLRRVETLNECIHGIFDILPPEEYQIPDKDKIILGNIYLHSFYINLSGAIDNLAWVFIIQSEINGIKKQNVGLRTKNKTVLEQLPQDFVNYLNEKEKWFQYLESYRDALAHQIPLYIPPYCVINTKHDEYQRLEQLKEEALANTVIKKQNNIYIFKRSIRTKTITSLGELKYLAKKLEKLNSDFSSIKLSTRE